jgi:hypothetical protein
MVNFCINPKTEFYDSVHEFVVSEIDHNKLYEGLTRDQIDKLIKDRMAEVTDKLNQPEFDKWYGNGLRDHFDQPKLVDGIYLINEDRKKISLKDLYNDKVFEDRENYKKDFTSINKIDNFLKESETAISKRISAFRDTKYAEKLKNLLDYLHSEDAKDRVKALNAHYDYMLKTTSVFEMEFLKYDRTRGIKGNKGKDKEFKNFLVQAHNFLSSFAKVKNLEIPAIGTKEEKEVIENLKKLEERITELTNRTNSELEGVVRDRLEEYIENPEVKQGVVDFLAAQTDESKIQLMLDALGDSHVSFIAGIDKLFKRTMFDRDEHVKEMTKEWDKLVNSFQGKFNDFLEKVLEKADGEKTGRFIPKFSEDYYSQLYEHRAKLDTLKGQGLEKTEEYKKELDKYYTWKKENTEQKYVKQYYDSLNLLHPLARQVKEDIDLKKSMILQKGKEKLTPEDYEALRELDNEMKWHTSTTNKDGSPKTGIDLDIANSLFKYRKAMSEMYYTVNINEKAFKKAKKEAEEKGEDMEKWMADNTVEDFSDAFWNMFEEIRNRMPSSKELKKIEDQIKQLTIAYKNEKGEIKVSELPKDIREQLDSLNETKENIKAMLKESLSMYDRYQLAEEFRRYIKFEPTTEYIKTLNEMNEKRQAGKMSQTAFDRWYVANHSLNEYTGEMQPLSIWTRMKPRDDRFIIRKPNKYWRITDIKPEYLNPNFKRDANGYPVPTDKWLNSKYQDLSDNDKEMLNKIQGMLLFLTEHTKNDIIKKGYLPAVPKETRNWKDIILNTKQPQEDNEFTDVVVTESDDIVKFIPLLYAKRLNQQAVPQLGTGATEQENKEIEEKRKKIIEENRKAHGSSIDYDLANTMKDFIKTALNHKYKSDIEIDMKIFREQLKQQKVKVTNDRGSKLTDKIKSRLSGTAKDHEVSAIGSNTEKHFLEWLDGVFYEDFEKDEGWLTKGVNSMTNLTSMTTLGFNVFSALNNKIIGNVQARIEAAGGTHFDYSDYRIARKQYAKSMIDYVANHNTDASTDFTDGLIKYFDVVVSQDELNRKPQGKLQTIAHKIRKLKSTAYFLQHIGEHQIQNTALLAMLHSHRVVNGKIMNFNEFWESKKLEINFDKKMSPEQIDIEVKKINENHQMKATMKEEFEKHPKLVDQLELKDGHISIKEGANIDKKEIFNFGQRVIGVNQRLHGIYNTEDAAIAQRHALGRLAMQFRKWMRPMWNRRFGRRFGEKTWNERVRDYEEGMYVNTFKYLASPAIENWKEFRKLKEKTAAKAFSMILRSMRDTFSNLKVRWHTLSEVEKANARRTAAEFTFLIATICLGFMFKAMKGDGDDDDNKMLILALYQADRVYGELTTFNIGVARDGNRLVSSPAPVFSTFEDMLKIAYNIFLWPFRDEEQNKFKSGIYHGEDKIEIYLKQMIPFVNQIQKWDYMGEQNQRYGFFR